MRKSEKKLSGFANIFGLIDRDSLERNSARRTVRYILSASRNLSEKILFEDRFFCGSHPLSSSRSISFSRSLNITLSFSFSISFLSLSSSSSNSYIFLSVVHFLSRNNFSYLCFKIIDIVEKGKREFEHKQKKSIQINCFYLV